MYTMKMRFVVLIFCLLQLHIFSYAQQTWFVDGYHGGVWGHYPAWQTQFMVDTLRAHPDWKINLEIEPETWDTVALKDPVGYKNFQQLFTDASTAERIEFINPAYAQSYMYTSSGESMIRQLYYGMQKIKTHFPSATFLTYSSEEPCFTSALPQVLKSFGFKYAVLKNPNTCWGGYTKNNGGEMMHWVGPDGSTILLVPRYASEQLERNSTWQTTAWTNVGSYFKDAFAQGIQHPVGMCLQDAGWKNGEWLGLNKRGSVYTTWRNYFSSIADTTHAEDWHISQEDMHVSLVWGSQVLQRIAQQVRVAENKIIVAEKMAAISAIENHTVWPKEKIDDAWRTLMLSQHHDCWIVPYNGRRGDTWADKVKTWTANTNSIANTIINAGATATKKDNVVTVYNTMGVARNEFVKMKMPAALVNAKHIVVKNGVIGLPVQIIDVEGEKHILFEAAAPAMGYSTLELDTNIANTPKILPATIVEEHGKFVMETMLYKMIIDPAKGGAVTSLVAKNIGNKDFADATSTESFNALRGNFFDEGGLSHSTSNKATVQVVENGPLEIKLVITNAIAGNQYTQTITMQQNRPRIDFDIHINWNNNTGIGEDYKQQGGYEATDLHKAFYNDTSKLLITFPLALKKQKVFVDAPFDVTASTLSNTFFNRWDSIKNNIMLNWVDVTDANETCGLALLTDRTTSYVHGSNFPLALTVQYSGVGLWGRNYTIDGPTDVHYAIIPHKGNWKSAGIYAATTEWHEPLMAFEGAKQNSTSKSFVDCGNSGYTVSSFTKEDDHYLLRLLNMEGSTGTHTIQFGFNIQKAVAVQLNGEEIKALDVQKNAVQLSIPEKGFVTLKLYKAE